MSASGPWASKSVERRLSVQTSMTDLLLEIIFRECDLGSIPAGCHMWVEFVVGSRLAPRVFLLVLRFSSLRKNQHLQIPIRPG